MSGRARTLYPEGVIGAPKHRRGRAAESVTGLPACTEVFSADNHISVADDIFYERFPDDLKDYAPRIWYEDGGGILDRHPGLRVGWFEGGIAWVPTALQDAEHVLASYRHMLKGHPEHDIRYYWDQHMCASFMVDGLGLGQLEEIGIDKVMWSSDYPHNESTFGYSERSLAAVVDAVGPDDAARVVSGNIKRFLGI
ncbi:hypothetical protein A5696_06495 [Mycobacterium sp. E2699]|uniref:amidohydrolase family protein n=1 Tax=Mycobacterium sp. E2699 TaxID=1834137 RepID=UPI0007FECB9A|nr:amidohydrolase family protein [Mycobacterium sp. E2699]OBH04286.1 hypothetical protein A5696_06495 [Mycobacterium sp. E2699]